MSILSVKNVGKQYPLRRETGMLAKEAIRRLIGRRGVGKFWALKNVSFDVKKGQSLGIIGANGSGKSTLLRVIAGITCPTEGTVTTKGRIASLLELGAGFHPYLTGRENVYLNGALLGIRRDEISRKFASILDFSGIGEFIDAPVKDYSSGMFVRLAFAVAIHSDPDIFLVDEVLSVGDEEFQLKCRERIRALQRGGKTILFVSHDLAQVNEICDELVLLSHGEMVRYGDTDETINYYLQTVGNQSGIATLQAGDLEIVFNNGRMAIFWRGSPITKRLGWYASFLYRGGWHETTQASWKITSADENEVTAVGTAWRLPVEYRWHTKLSSNKTVELTLDIRSTRRIDLEKRHISLILRPEFSRWSTSFEQGAFVPREPSDTDWHPLTAGSESSDLMGAYSEDTDLPVVIEEIVDRAATDISLVLNSDYVLDAGILQTAGDFTPAELDTMAQGEFLSLSRLKVTLDNNVATLEKRVAAAVATRTMSSTLEAGDLTVRFDRGRLHMLWKDVEFTTEKCGYTAILSGGFWHESVVLACETFRPDDQTLVIEGSMRRLPLDQRWTVRAEGDGIVSWTVDFIARDRFEIAEWHASVLISTAFDRWSTPHEIGVFPNIDEGQDDWVHVNRMFQTGAWVSAESDEPGLPREIRFETGTADNVFVPTALNTSFAENARVLQSLEVRSGSARFITLGEHCMLSGRLVVTPPSDLIPDKPVADSEKELRPGTQNELPLR